MQLKPGGRVPFPMESAYCSQRLGLLVLMPADVADEDQRPTLEGRSGRFSLPASDYATCSFEDSRMARGLPMNVGAMRQWVRHEAGAIQWMRQVMMSVREVTAEADSKTLCYLGLHACARSPLFRVIENVCGSRPLDAVVQGEISASSKLAQGLVALDWHSLDRDGLLKLDFGASGEEIYRYADAQGLLQGPLESCPASSRVIMRVLGQIFAPLGALQEEHASASFRLIGLSAAAMEAAEYIAFVYDTLRIFYGRTFGAEQKELRTRYGHPRARNAVAAAQFDAPSLSPQFRFQRRVAERPLAVLGIVEEAAELERYLHGLERGNIDRTELKIRARAATLGALNEVGRSLEQVFGTRSQPVVLSDVRVIFGDFPLTASGGALKD